MSNGRIYLKLIFIFSVPAALGITSTKYMTHYCHHNVIFANSSTIIELTNNLLEVEPKNHIHCAAKIVTDPDSRLLLHFITLDISYHNLSPDRLHIYDYSRKGNASQVSPAGGLYGIYDQYYTRTSSGVQDYLSSGNMFRLDYMGKPSLLYRGFRILITSVKDPHPDGGCASFHSRCLKGSICIPTSTLCNGDHNCGAKDDSDETQCNWVLSTGLEEKYAIGNVITAGALASLSFVLVVVLVFGVIYRINKRSYLRRESIQVHARRNADGKWKITNDMGLTAQIYAPPTYDDVVAVEENEEPPPAYESLPCSVRNSCELRHSRSGSLTIVCVPNRDIHLHNEALNLSEMQCFIVSSEEELHTDSNETSTSEPSYAQGSCIDSDISNQFQNESICEKDQVSVNSQSENSSSDNKKTDSNENLIRPKLIGIVDDGIEYMDVNM
ncbi:uncharacterized protein [Mytilus edulis]|uniref:uncharacterized protein n=1 Tax=Mytilus edulis TaxID=6550 RepID=UPI0039EDF505